MSKTLDLGCGPHPQNPYKADEVYGVDIRSGLGPTIACADLAVEPIPFDSEMFDTVTAFHFMEHIPRVIYLPHRRLSFVELMNEIYRVLKIGGLFLSFTPALPDLAGTFEDPTHVNTITEGTFSWYFDDTHLRARAYGFTGKFEIVDQQWVNGSLLTQMRKLPV
ncbi:MAG: class I SAM-dependent methyltransferase [Methylococcaceae bacterium]|nr:class I SAM-dependent methyltransferase [Methylococcaceae bacterium]